eukprot:SAG31_NODE_3_length_45830_cov_42.279701_33_plen_304_part_00
MPRPGRCRRIFPNSAPTTRLPTLWRLLVRHLRSDSIISAHAALKTLGHEIESRSRCSCAPWTNPPPLSSKGIVEDVQPSMAVSSMIHEQNKYAQDLRETKEKALVQALRATLANRTRNPLWQNRSAWPTRTGLLAGFGPLGQQGRWAHLLGGQGSSISEANSHAPHLGASNNWVVDGQFTTTGRPLLANDPHLTMTAPAVWMLIHLESPSYSAIGSALAGTPFVVIGKNSKVGWGVTNTGVDVQDLYIIEEQSAHSYKLDGKPEKYKNYRTEIIKVKGDKDVRFPVKETVFGPVIVRTYQYFV